MTNLQRIGGPTPPPGPERTRYLVRGTVAPVFLEAHAIAPADAIAYAPVHQRDRRQFEAMLRDGSIKRGAEGRYWFDAAAYEAAAAARGRRLALILLAVAIAIAVVAALSYDQGTLTPR